MARTVAHAGVHAQINAALFRHLPAGWCLWIENPIRLDEGHTPLPDTAIVRGAPADYIRAGRYPAPADLALVVEVAQTSLRNDIDERKKPGEYARAFVPAYWVADVAGRRLLVHSDPRVEEGRAHFASIVPHVPGQSVALRLDREVLAIPVEELLP